MDANKFALSNFFPPLLWARKLDRDTVVKDVFAALIVTMMLVPQALAYAMVAGMPPYVGLYVSILPPLMYCLFGTSMFLSVGVCAIIAILTATGASMAGPPGSEAYVNAGSLLALMSGGLLIIFGVLRLGFITNFLSHTVISGFVTGSVLTIAATQVKHLTGIPAKGDTLIDIGRSILSQITHIHSATVILGLLSLAGFLVMRRYLKTWLQMVGLSPSRAALFAGIGPFLVITTAIIVSGAIHLDLAGIKVVGKIPSGLPSLGFPSFDLQVPADKAAEYPTVWALWRALGSHALLMAIIIFVESVSVGQALAAKSKQQIKPNQEMIAVGIAGLASAVSGGYPVAGGFSRSAVNYNAGAQTPLAGILTSVGIAIVVAFLTGTLFYLPLATLAALIVIAAVTMVDVHIFVLAWNYSKRDFAAAAATFAMTVSMGVEQGLITGLLLSVALHIYHTSRPHFAFVGLVPGTQHFRNVKRHDVITSENVISLRVDESLYFANANFLEQVVNSAVAEHPDAKHLVLMCSAVNHIDMSALEVLETVNRRLKEAGITLHMSEIKGPVKDRLKRTDFVKKLTGRVFLSHYEAVTTLAPDMVTAPALDLDEAEPVPA